MTLLDALPPEERPRERLLSQGATALTDAELLALLFGSGTRGKHAITLASELLVRCHGVAGLPRLDVDGLKQTPGIGTAKACLLAAAFELGRRAILASLKNGEPLTNPSQVKDYCRANMGHLRIEHCRVILLDSLNRVISDHEVSRGTLGETPIYPREIARLALGHHAAAVIIVHNHPSGLAEPSDADLHMTAELTKALELIDVMLLDHLIVAGPNVISLAESGHLDLLSSG
ncbi:RadC family protein [Orrella marina]|uniref:MPN domain-containing protein n=1 Tax=Orrella marina TaxID=2163011 RepID=A0A2R4XIU0_9BURK|nr:DNA repair protein RadC [Orrella marina]AWB33736.1 hypothetical protein DBV39_08495 [Orrella marina]